MLTFLLPCTVAVLSGQAALTASAAGTLSPETHS